MSQGESIPEYNGYPNKPTWTVALWLDNERASYDDVRGVMADMVREGGHEADYANLVTSTAYDLASWLKEYVTSRVELDKATMRADLLGWALAYVDWRYLAESYLRDALDEQEYERKQQANANAVADGGWPPYPSEY